MRDVWNEILLGLGLQEKQVIFVVLVAIVIVTLILSFCDGSDNSIEEKILEPLFEDMTGDKGVDLTPWNGDPDEKD